MKIVHECCQFMYTHYCIMYVYERTHWNDISRKMLTNDSSYFLTRKQDARGQKFSKVSNNSWNKLFKSLFWWLIILVYPFVQFHQTNWIAFDQELKYCFMLQIHVCFFKGTKFNLSMWTQWPLNRNEHPFYWTIQIYEWDACHINLYTQCVHTHTFPWYPKLNWWRWTLCEFVIVMIGLKMRLECFCHCWSKIWISDTKKIKLSGDVERASYTMWAWKNAKQKVNNYRFRISE